MNSGIYKITNIVNGKFYIGSSNDIEYRWECHKRNLNSNKHDNQKFQNAWNFYGQSKFQFDIIEIVKPISELLLEREQYHLDLWKPYHRIIGYNICPKAEGGDNITYNPNREQFIETMKEISSGEGNPMFGKKHTKDAINKQKSRAIGRYTLKWFIDKYGDLEGNKKFQERRMMLTNRKINYSYDNGCKGKKRGPMSDEIKIRISERKAKLKVIRPQLHKDILSNQFSMKQLAEKYETSISTIKNEKKKVSF